MTWADVVAALVVLLGGAIALMVVEPAYAVTNPGFVTCPAGTEPRLWDFSYQCWNPTTSSYVQPLVYTPPAAIPGQAGQVFCGGDYWAVAAGELGAELWCSESWLFGPDIEGLQLDSTPSITIEQWGALMSASLLLLSIAFGARVIIRASRGAV